MRCIRGGWRMAGSGGVSPIFGVLFFCAESVPALRASWASGIRRSRLQKSKLLKNLPSAAKAALVFSVFCGTAEAVP